MHKKSSNDRYFVAWRAISKKKRKTYLKIYVIQPWGKKKDNDRKRKEDASSHRATIDRD